jgi:hypothetical protein
VSLSSNETIKSILMCLNFAGNQANVKQESPLPALGVLIVDALPNKPWPGHVMIGKYSKLFQQTKTGHRSTTPTSKTLTVVDLSAGPKLMLISNERRADSELFNSDLNIASFRGNQ